MEANKITVEIDWARPSYDENVFDYDEDVFDLAEAYGCTAKYMYEVNGWPCFHITGEKDKVVRFLCNEYCSEDFTDDEVLQVYLVD